MNEVTSYCYYHVKHFIGITPKSFACLTTINLRDSKRKEPGAMFIDTVLHSKVI